MSCFRPRGPVRHSRWTVEACRSLRLVDVSAGEAAVLISRFTTRSISRSLLENFTLSSVLKQHLDTSVPPARSLKISVSWVQHLYQSSFFRDRTSVKLEAKSFHPRVFFPLIHRRLKTESESVGRDNCHDWAPRVPAAIILRLIEHNYSHNRFRSVCSNSIQAISWLINPFF